jgi:hypothetical protein
MAIVPPALAANMGAPFGRPSPFEGEVGSAVSVGLGAAVSVAGRGGKVGTAGVLVGMPAKIAVSVGLGVGNVNGVGGAMPGRVQALARRIRMINGRMLLPRTLASVGMNACEPKGSVTRRSQATAARAVRSPLAWGSFVFQAAGALGASIPGLGVPSKQDPSDGI